MMHVDITDYSDVKKNEIIKVKGKRMELKTTILGQKNQTEGPWRGISKQGREITVM